MGGPDLEDRDMNGPDLEDMDVNGPDLEDMDMVGPLDLLSREWISRAQARDHVGQLYSVTLHNDVVEIKNV